MRGLLLKLVRLGLDEGSFYGGDHFGRGGEKDQSFFNDHLSVHQDAEFAAITIGEFRFQAGFLLNEVRHTGGTRAEARSDFAIADGDSFHLPVFSRLAEWCASSKSEPLSRSVQVRTNPMV